MIASDTIYIFIEEHSEKIFSIITCMKLYSQLSLMQRNCSIYSSIYYTKYICISNFMRPGVGVKTGRVPETGTGYGY
jgi:hypothetical protein